MQDYILKGYTAVPVRIFGTKKRGRPEESSVIMRIALIIYFVVYIL
jgi:hypothetical protein